MRTTMQLKKEITFGRKYKGIGECIKYTPSRLDDMRMQGKHPSCRTCKVGCTGDKPCPIL